MSRIVAGVVLALSIGAAATGCMVEDCDPSWQTCHDQPRYEYVDYTGGTTNSGNTYGNGSRTYNEDNLCVEYCDRLSVCGASQARDLSSCVAACKDRFARLPQQTAELCACIPQSRCEDAVEGRCSPDTSGTGGSATAGGGGAPGAPGQTSSGAASGNGVTAGTGGSSTSSASAGQAGSSSMHGGYGRGGASHGTGGSAPVSGSAGTTSGSGVGGTHSGSGGTPAAAGASCDPSPGTAGEAPSEAGQAGAPQAEPGIACTCDCQCPGAQRCIDGYCCE
jgi:hypothetical protein